MKVQQAALVFVFLTSTYVSFAQSPTDQTSVAPGTDTQKPTAKSEPAQTQTAKPQPPSPKPIVAGPITLDVQRFDRTSFSDIFASLNELLVGKVVIQSGSDPNKRIDIDLPATLLDLTNQINAENKGITAELAPEKSGNKLTLKSQTNDPTQVLSVTGELATKPPEAKATHPDCKCDKDIPEQKFTFASGTPDYVITLDAGSKAQLLQLQTTGNAPSVYILGDAGAVFDLSKNPWRLDGQAKPLGVLMIGYQNDPICDKETTHSLQDVVSKHCHEEFTLARRLDQADVILATELLQPKLDNTRLDKRYLIIESGLLEDKQQFVLVNGQRLRQVYGPFQFDLSFAVSFSIYRMRDGCRLFSKADYDWASLKFYPPPPPRAGSEFDNGITVGPGKIFDTLVLKKMLNDTAAQLASLSGFSSVSITNAFGNLQGVTRDVSFLSAQVTTTPLPGITSTLANGTTGNSTNTNNTPIAGSPGIVTVQCPDGSLPTIGSGGLQGCAANPSSANVNGSTSSVTTLPAGTSQQVTGSTNNQQNTQTTTSASIAPTIPTVPVSTAFSAPTNVGVASADVLAEQVQLNSQITTLRLLLQGAASDQYLTAESRAVATRQQTTLGFSVSLDPPRQYKHAVAEVRIIIVPPIGRDGVSIMTLLPTEKTYNVAKVTSHQNSFGAGVTVEPVSAGVSTGKTKDRLYLAKDTDTIALQYKEPTATQVPLPFWHKIHDDIVGSVNLNPFDPCVPLTAPTKGAVVFGWQFRPVLGAEYVKGGQRQVFAQLALPAGLNQEYVPTVYIQTLWRTYDSKRQVVGAVYKQGCSVDTDRSGVTLLNPLIVREMNVSDIGNGQVRLTAKGSFFASGMTVRSGFNNVTPTTFDGTNIETFASIHDVLQTGDLSLVSQNGIKQQFAILTDPVKSLRCGITEADMVAVPHPDGNARVHLHMKLGSDYVLDDDADGQPQPFTLIGSQVYGIQESPFVNSPGCRPGANRSQGSECDYEFLAPNSALKNAQAFLVQDISWDSLKKRGTINFAPAFDKLAISSAYPATKDPPRDTDTTFLAVSGFDLLKLDTSDNCTQAQKNYCLTLFVGNESKPTSLVNVATENVATVLLSAGAMGKAKSIRFQVHDKRPGYEAVEWDLTVPKADDTTKPSVSPSYLYKGDSETATISGGGLNFSYVKDVLFDGKVYFTPLKKPDASKLELLVSTDVTKTSGRKEFTIEFVDEAGKPSKTTISIDVVLR